MHAIQGSSMARPRHHARRGPITRRARDINCDVPPMRVATPSGDGMCGPALLLDPHTVEVVAYLDQLAPSADLSAASNCSSS